MSSECSCSHIDSLLACLFAEQPFLKHFLPFTVMGFHSDQYLGKDCSSQKYENKESMCETELISLIFKFFQSSTPRAGALPSDY